MKYFFTLLVAVLLFTSTQAQELFLFTYPASNVPKNTLVARGMNSFFERTADNSISYRFMPEVMYGVSKKTMLAANAFISNENNRVNFEGASLFAQYRFFSKDDINRHFRMALWSRAAINNAEFHQDEIELSGHNTGIRSGLTATQLLHKTALSTTVSYQKAFNNINNKLPPSAATEAVDYTFSIGHLLLPKKYKTFAQTNFNFMVEILGQTHLKNGNSFLDVAPVAQFIFNSTARLDIAYRREIASSIYRTEPNGILVNFQYSFFNLIK